jgi:disease resistance protein RPM1
MLSHILQWELIGLDFHVCRYFIVMDDIWEPESWETIKLAFVENDHGNRIITTSRKFDVAIAAGEVYKLQPLSYDNSKRLFYKRIFGDEEKILPNHLDDTANKVLNKCGGIPLAIITMASLLVGKPDGEGEWPQLCSAIGFGHVDNVQACRKYYVGTVSKLL